jgi:DNA-binding MarR family transcriptional regulator
MKKSHGQRIGYLSRMAHRYFNEKLGELGIGSGQIFILKDLYHHDGIHQEVLVNHCQVHKANITRALSKLEENGFIRREADPLDKRAKLIHLTAKAIEMKKEFFTIFKSWSEMLTQGFSEDEKDLTLKLLDRMAANVEPYYGD